MNFKVYFDDFKVTHTKSPVVQSNDHFAHGMDNSALSYQRENSTKNNFLYNAGSEVQASIDANVYDTYFRGLDVSTGRWQQVDPLSDDFQSHSPYVAMFNDPVFWNDPLGDCPNCDAFDRADREFERMNRLASGYYPTQDDDMYGGMFRFGPGFIAGGYYGSGKLAQEYTVYEHWTDYNTNGDPNRPIGSQFNGYSYERSDRDLRLNNGGEGKHSLFEKTLIFINEFNPVANAWDAVSGFVNGTDRFGNPISNGEATLEAASIIPVGKIFSVGKYAIRSDALAHIFRNVVGHVNPQTAASQFRYMKLFSDVASNPSNLVKTANAEAAKAGVQTFMQSFNNGTVWVQVRNGQIFDAGVNKLIK